MNFHVNMSWPISVRNSDFHSSDSWIHEELSSQSSIGPFCGYPNPLNNTCILNLSTVVYHGDNEFGDEGSGGLVGILVQYTTMTHLDLNWNGSEWVSSWEKTMSLTGQFSFNHFLFNFLNLWPCPHVTVSTGQSFLRKDLFTFKPQDCHKDRLSEGDQKIWVD